MSELKTKTEIKNTVVRIILNRQYGVSDDIKTWCNKYDIFDTSSELCLD